MDKERLILGTVAGICVVALVLALTHRGADEGGTARPGEETAAGAVSDGSPAAQPPEGLAAEAQESPVPAGAAEGKAAPSPSPAATETPSFLSEQNRRDVTLFFEMAHADFLGPERRRIFETASPVDQAKQIVVELIGGPRSASLLPTLAPETRLLGLFLAGNGTAYVDLSGEAVRLHPGGSSEELATVFSLVDSLTYNLPQVKRVHILIDGEERDTFKDHLDLRRDYRPDLSIVDMGGRS
jgi:Sporulation and spore germination